MNTDDNETRRQWVKRITEGERSPFDHLTDGERLVLQALKTAGYELKQVGRYGRYIRRGAA